MIAKLWALITAAMAAGFTPGKIVGWVIKYGPLIQAFMKFLEEQKDARERQEAAEKFERAFRVATETKDTAELEALIRSHCGPDGCRLP